jgi:hypothetical protein
LMKPGATCGHGRARQKPQRNVDPTESVNYRRQSRRPLETTSPRQE